MGHCGRDTSRKIKVMILNQKVFEVSEKQCLENFSVF